MCRLWGLVPDVAVGHGFQMHTVSKRASEGGPPHSVEGPPSSAGETESPLTPSPSTSLLLSKDLLEPSDSVGSVRPCFKRPDNLGLILRTHVVEGDKQFPQVVL